MPWTPPSLPIERRSEERCAAGGFRLLSPADAIVLDCGTSGVGIETRTYLAVGSLTSLSLFLPAGEMSLLGKVCWARMVGSRRLGAGESEPIFRVGLSFVEGQSLDGWKQLRRRLLASDEAPRRTTPRPRRRVIKWRPPRPV